MNSVFPVGKAFAAAFVLLAARSGHALTRPAATGQPWHEQVATHVASTDRFQFHSDPWINLHHFLYQWSRAEEGLGQGRQHVPVPERSTLAELTDAERQAWLQAVAFYRAAVAERHHFDTEMLELKRQLRLLGGDPQAGPPDVIEGVADALATAMPVYRARWWPEHDEANRAWVGAVVPLLRRHEAGFVELTNRVYRAEWPDERFRADVSAYANWAAGYTAFGHITISSTDPGNQDHYALEMIFHEVQHTRAVGGNGRHALSAAFEEVGLEPPGDVWHALIFATAGEFARSVARAEGLPEHTPYWIREGFESFRGWSALVPAVNEHWLPVVRGESTKAAGFEALVHSLGSGEGAD